MKKKLLALILSLSITAAAAVLPVSAVETNNSYDVTEVSSDSESSVKRFYELGKAEEYIRESLLNRDKRIKFEYVCDLDINPEMVDTDWEEAGIDFEDPQYGFPEIFGNESMRRICRHDPKLPFGGDYMDESTSVDFNIIAVSSCPQGYIYSFDCPVNYYESDEQFAFVDSKTDEIIAQLDLDSKSDYEKIEAIFAYITSHVVYDYEHLDDEDYKLQYTAYAALHDGQCVCVGYSSLMYCMMLKAGIDCRIIGGEGGAIYGGIGGVEGHAWNIVRLGDKYYNCDSTWDSGNDPWYFFLLADDSFNDHPSHGHDRFDDWKSEEFYEQYPMATEDHPYPDDISGKCGDNLTWTYSKGTLTVSGSGEMIEFKPDENFRMNIPWLNLQNNIRKLIIGEGVTSVSDFAFSDFTNIKSVVLPSTLKKIGNNAFSGCEALKALVIPDSVTTLGKSAFCSCSSLSSVKLSSNTRELPSELFMSCYSLTEINIPEGVERIGENAFSTGNGSSDNVLGLQKITLPSSLKAIEAQAFSVTSFETFTIPDTVEEIGGGAFSGAFRLREIIVSESNPNFSVIDGVLYDKSRKKLISYPLAKKDTSYTVPRGVEIIDDNAFLEAVHLNCIVLPDTVRSIGKNAFNGTRITSIVLPDKIEEIPESAFSGTPLTSVVLPKGLKRIGWQAFAWTDLQAVTIPKDVTEITYSFVDCAQTTDVYCYANADALKWNTPGSDTGGFFTDFAEEQKTIVHVKSDQLQSYIKKFGDLVNANFVGDLTDDASVSKLKLSAQELYIDLGKTQGLAAIVVPDNAINKDIVWKSSDETVASVNDIGNVTAISCGTATITATSKQGGFSDSCVVTVQEELIHHNWKIPTCEEGGNIEYWSRGDRMYADEECTEEIDQAIIGAFGHSWDEPAWNWDNGQVTVTVTCQNDTSHVKTVEAKVFAVPSVDDTVILRAYANIDGFEFSDERKGPFDCTPDTADMTDSENTPDIPDPVTPDPGVTYPDINRFWGDANNDGNVDSADALSALRISTGLDIPDINTIIICDIDGDHALTSADALAILRFSVGFIDNAAIGTPAG